MPAGKDFLEAKGRLTKNEEMSRKLVNPLLRTAHGGRLTECPIHKIGGL
jgi:hypothetical protein